MTNTANYTAFYRRRWLLFTLVSMIFFLITAATFTSLGVVMPYMVKDLNWTRPEAGLGFSLLALMVGLAAPIPAYLLRFIGLKATYFFGGVLVITGAVLLATTTSLTQFYIGAAFLGFGYSHCASVPAMYFLNSWMPDKQPFAIGAFMMIGGLGGVAGPFAVTSAIHFTGTWHAHWWTMALAMLILTLLGLLFFKDPPEDMPDSVKAALSGGKNKQKRVHKSSLDWTLKEVLRKPQYYIIVFSLTLILLCSVTMNSWAFTHMTTLGVTTTTAAAALSMQAVVNAVSRAIGGSLANFIDPKWLLVSALGADVIGMTALSYANNPFARIVFIIADGYGFGMCFFATTMLLVNYFGTKASPEVIGTMNFFTVMAMVGPVAGGIIGESLGGFTWVFRGLACLLLVFLFVVIAMRPPRHQAEKTWK